MNLAAVAAPLFGAAFRRGPTLMRTPVRRPLVRVRCPYGVLVTDTAKPCAEVIHDALLRLACYDDAGYTRQHGSTRVTGEPPPADELRTASWQQDGCRLDVVGARGVAIIYVDGRSADQVLHPTEAFTRAVELGDISFRLAATRYGGWH